jgi:hypothetical protein
MMMKVAHSAENLIVPYKQTLDRRATPVEITGKRLMGNPSERTEFEWCHDDSQRTVQSSANGMLKHNNAKVVRNGDSIISAKKEKQRHYIEQYSLHNLKQ